MISLWVCKCLLCQELIFVALVYIIQLIVGRQLGGWGAPDSSWRLGGSCRQWPYHFGTISLAGATEWCPDPQAPSLCSEVLHIEACRVWSRGWLVPIPRQPTGAEAQPWSLQDALGPSLTPESGPGLRAP